MIEIKHVIISSYSYGAPEVSSYGAPEPAYAEPVVEEYSAPAYTAEGEVLDIGSLVLPILVIVGELTTINGIRGPSLNLCDHDSSVPPLPQLHQLNNCKKVIQ